MDVFFSDPRVAAAFAAFPDAVRDDLTGLRALILETAARTPDVGAIEETVKWGQPAYLTSETKSGTTIRLAAVKTGGYGLFVHCQTSLIAGFRVQFPGVFRYDGTRGVLFDAGQAGDRDMLGLFIARALTYHR